MPCAFDSRDKFALVFCTRSRDALWNNLAFFGYESLQFFFVLVVNVDLFIIAESTRSPALDGLLRLLRTSSLMLYPHDIYYL